MHSKENEIKKVFKESKQRSAHRIPRKLANENDDPPDGAGVGPGAMVVVMLGETVVVGARVVAFVGTGVLVVVAFVTGGAVVVALLVGVGIVVVVGGGVVVVVLSFGPKVSSPITNHYLTNPLTETDGR